MIRPRIASGAPSASVSLLAILLLSAIGTGCLYAGGAKRIESDEDSRIVVRFSGTEAAREFHEAFRRSDPEPYTEKSGFIVPLVLARGEAVYHETLHYNAAVRRADVDRDGRITTDEAREYAVHVDRPPYGTPAQRTGSGKACSRGPKGTTRSPR